jgi:integrase
MPLSNTAITAARPKAKPFKLFDGGGLYLLVMPTAAKLWRLKYRFGGKEKKLALGVFPDTGLKEARAKRDAARQLLAEGTDPSSHKKALKLSRVIGAANTFKAVANEYIDKKEREGLASVTLAKARWLSERLNAKIGRRPIAEITVQELLVPLRVAEHEGNLETARRMRSFAGRVFRYAIATGRAQRDLSFDIRGALTAPKVTHRAAILHAEEVGPLLRAIDSYGGHAPTVFALQLAPHVFVRPGELRQAEWNEIDFESAVWTIPDHKMKMGKAHRVPLSRQAIAILKSAHMVSGGKRYVFPSVSSTKRPISENTLNGALRRMGFDKSQMSAHGFRAMASSLLNESGKWQPDAIERALAHGDDNAVRGAYNRGAYWDERVRMAQWWSDYLDELREDAGSPIP